MRTWMIWVIGIIVAFVVAMPWIPFAPHLGAGARLPFYSDFGAWLQGILTPAALLVAILAFQAQARASREANRIANRTFFIANVERFVGHLAYRSLCALVDGTPSDVTRNDPQTRDEILGALIELLTRYRTSWVELAHRRVLTLEQLRRSSHYAILKEDIDDILAAGRDAELDTLLDNRIMRIRDGINRNPPISDAAEPTGN